jgi:hypothetical protein
MLLSKRVFLAFLCAVSVYPGCAKRKKTTLDFENDQVLLGLYAHNGVTLEISGKSSAGTLEFDEPPPNGAPVTLTFVTPCGPQKVTFPLFIGSYNGVVVPPDKMPLSTFVRIDPRVKSPLTIAGRTVTDEQISGSGSGWHAAYFLGMDCGGKATIGDIEFSIPPWTPSTRAEDQAGVRKDGNSLFVTDRAENCFELRHLHYGGNAPASPPTLLRGQHAYWVPRWIDFFMTPESMIVPVRKKGDVVSKKSLQVVDCPKETKKAR